MKRLVIGTLLAILLLFVSACSENHTFRVTHWGMSVEEVRQTESLELTDANEVSPQTLIYAYPTTGSGESEVMYIFPDEFNQTLNAAAYWYRLEPLEERTILLQNLRMDLSESYGPPIPSKTAISKDIHGRMNRLCFGYMMTLVLVQLWSYITVKTI